MKYSKRVGQSGVGPSFSSPPPAVGSQAAKQGQPAPENPHDPDPESSETMKAYHHTAHAGESGRFFPRFPNNYPPSAHQHSNTPSPPLCSEQTQPHHRSPARHTTQANIPPAVNSSLPAPTHTRSPCCARPPTSIESTTKSTSIYQPLKTSSPQ